MSRLLHCTLMSLLLIATARAQSTWYVDDDNCPGGSGTLADPFCRIQDALAAAHDGDTVVVLPGSYAGGLDFVGKGIALVSRDGAATTIVDGGAPLVLMQLGGGVTATLAGFTLTHGSDDRLGRATVVGIGEGRIASNRIVENDHVYGTGGIFADGAWLIENRLRR